MTLSITDNEPVAAELIHLILFPVEGVPRPQCPGSGPCTMRVADVTCPDCLQLPAVRSLQAAEPVVHDTHAIPAGDEPEHAAALTRLGDVYAQPDKTHDLSIVRAHGNVVIEAAAETDGRVVYLQDGAAQDLGRVLAVLTPTQIAVLVDDLTGGEK